jgi:hypothetical protein
MGAALLIGTLTLGIKVLALFKEAPAAASTLSSSRNSCR